MGIKPKFSKEDVKNMLQTKLVRIESAIIARLQYIGETFVNNARNNGAYLDHTGNLRSSVGYIVMKNGKILYENWKESNKGTDKKSGLAYGKNLALDIKTSLGKGYVLIVVAGMHYAAAVESKGKDVLTASSIIAKKDLEKAIQTFKKSL